MRRTKLVLAAAALMVAMLVAFSAPAMANTSNENNVQRSSSNIFDGDNNHNDIFDDDGDCCSDHDGHFNHNNNFGFNNFGFNTGCLEWSSVFEEWEWDCD